MVSETVEVEGAVKTVILQSEIHPTLKIIESSGIDNWERPEDKSSSMTSL
jgi:hypothetical protein